MTCKSKVDANVYIVEHTPKRGELWVAKDVFDELIVLMNDHRCGMVVGHIGKVNPSGIGFYTDWTVLRPYSGKITLTQV